MTARPKRRWYQFTVGGLLVLTTLVSLPLGWYAYERNKAWRAQKAIDDFHMLIRNAELAAQPQAIGQPLEKVRFQFAWDGHQLLATQDRQHDTKHRFLIREKAWGESRGAPHHLIVETTVDRQRKVDTVAAGLVGEPNIPFDDAIGNQLYPPGCAVERCLAQKEVREAAQKYPILKEVEITYDLTRNKWNDTGTDSYSFHVTVELGQSATDNRAGKSFHFIVGSNLDPPQDRKGKPLTQGFTPSSAVGEVWATGSGEWRMYETP